MTEFRQRLKEVREGLGYSQAEFAKECGVGKTAQYMYERGDREPSASYFQAARGLGADVLYLLTGEKSESEQAFYNAKNRLFLQVCELLGLDSDEMVHLSYQRLTIEEDRSVKNLLGQDDEISFQPWYENVRKWLATAKTPDACLDVALLSTVLFAIENQIDSVGARISAEKKAKVAIVLYRAFKVGGNFDQRLVEETIQLAAS